MANAGFQSSSRAWNETETSFATSRRSSSSPGPTIAEPIRSTDNPDNASLVNEDSISDERSVATRHSDLLIELAALRDARQHTDGTLTVILFDVDRFHEVNERFTPHDGDGVLLAIEQLIRAAGTAAMTSDHFLADQFLSLLPDGSAEEGIAFAERCRRRLIVHPPRLDGHEVEVTLSVGIVESSAGCPETAYQLIQRARIALNCAKQQGGNRIVTWTQVLSDPLIVPSPQATGRDVAIHWHARLRQHIHSTQMESMRALVAAVDARDTYTRTHSQTVASLARRIGRAMDLRGARLEALMAASLLHDVGKIGVPDAILTKPGPLTRDEFETIKRHPETALGILKSMSFLTDINPLILHHHERFDGTGYPARLRGGEIPIGARIIAVADALDTMLSPRTYKAAYTWERARAELLACAGTQFDPQVVSVTLAALSDELDGART